MSSPSAAKKPTVGGGFFDNLFRIRRRQYSDDGSSRRGRRYWDRGEDYSVGKDSSTHSALFDLELSHRGQRIGPLIDDRLAVAAASGAAAELHAKLQRLAYLSRPVAGFEVDLLHHVTSVRESCCGLDGNIDLMRMAKELYRMGYACSLQCNDQAALADVQPGTSASSTSAAATSTAADGTCLEKLRHSFLICTGRLDGSVTHYCLVDPHFRDQFRIGQPTEAYLSLLSVLTPEFVGSPLRLQALADLLCTEIVEVYREQNLPLPPWRKSGAMLSKWFDVATPAHAPAPLPRPPPLPRIHTQSQQPLGAVMPAAPMNYSHNPVDIVSVPEFMLPEPFPYHNVRGEGGSSGLHSHHDERALSNPNINLFRSRSGGWSDLATIVEAPSPHHPLSVASARATGSASDVLSGSLGGGTSPGGSSEDDHARQKSSGKVVSLLARGLSGLGLNKTGRKWKNGGSDSSLGGPSQRHRS